MRKTIKLTILSIMLMLMAGCGKSEEEKRIQAEQEAQAMAEAMAVDPALQKEPAEAEQIEEEETEEVSQEVVEAESDVNTNGLNFQMSEKCYNSYFEELKSGKAAERYAKYESDWGSELKYFSISGMAKDEPFLLLSEDGNSNEMADDIMVLLYTRDANGVTMNYIIDGMHQDNRDMSVGRHACEKNGMYVNLENDRYDFFVDEVIHYFADEFSGIEEDWDYTHIYYTYDSKMMQGERDARSGSGSVSQSMIESGRIAPIKWFSMEQIAEAEEYYSQYVFKPNYSDGSNRDDYYNNGDSVLKYLPYIEVGDFSVETDGEFGTDIYYFQTDDTDVGTGELYEAFKAIRDNSLFNFMSNVSSSAEFYHCFYRDENGKEVVIEVMHGVGRDVWKLQIRPISESAYQSVVDIYNSYNGTQATSVSEIYELNGK